MQPSASARHASVGKRAVPVVVEVLDADKHDDVVFEALEAGNGGPGDFVEGGCAELRNVGFGEAPEAHLLEAGICSLGVLRKRTEVRPRGTPSASNS